MKKTLSLVLAMVLSLAIFVADISGIVTVVRAEDNVVVDEGAADTTPAADPAPAVDPAPVPDPAPAVDPEEQARQEAAARAAQEAEEAQRQAEADEAARQAREQAEAEARAAQEAADKAAQEAEAAKEKAAANGYKLSAYVNGSAVSKIDFGTVSVGAGASKVLQITNNGTTTVNLIWTETDDASGAFNAAFQGGSTTLAPKQSAPFQVMVSSIAPAGTYSAKLLFADDDDPNYSKGLSVTLKATVKAGSSSITSVAVSPSKPRLAVGYSYPFTAKVKGTGDYSTDVVWSIANAKAKETDIDDNGYLTIADYETASTITVTATSVQDPSKSGKAVVTLQNGSYNVSATANPAVGGVVTGGGAVTPGGSATVSAVPNKNYYFAGWYQDGKVVSTSTNYTVSNVQGNIDLVAQFVQNYVTIKATANNNLAGTVVGGGTIPYGGRTVLSAKANNGYVFTGWKEGNNVLSTAASLELTNLTADRTIVAVFAQTSHTVVLSANPVQGGTVSGGGTFPLGQGTTVKAVPNTGWAFQGWAVNGQIVSKDATVKIDKLDQDYNFTAVFIQTGITTFNISAGVATTGGTISPSGVTVVPQGQSITYRITPKSGYAILAVAVDNVQMGPISTYTFSNVQGPHTIAAAFLLTDAGKAAQEAAGTKPQENKVEKLEKNESNTATGETIVDIEKAASGEGGDEYVEEMEGLDDIPIPTDAEISDQIIITSDSYGTLASLGMTVDEARAEIDNGGGADLLTAAYYDGSLRTSIVNDLAPVTEPTDYSSLSREELEQMAEDDIYPSFPNLDVVVQKMISDGETLSIVNGGSGLIGISLTKQDVSMVAPAVENAMKGAVGQKPLQYFDLTVMKDIDGYTENMTTIPEAVEIVIKVPDEIYKAGKTYSVLRVHDGEVAVLPDLDDDPETITFRTDAFSTYAIAEQVASTKQIVIRFAIGAAIALAVAVTCFLILMVHQAKVRRARRRERIERLRRERDGK